MRSKYSFSLMLKSRSGRYYQLSLFKSGGYLLLLLFILTSILVSLSLYTPFLHKYGGDWTGSSLTDIELNLKKLQQDHNGAIQNVLYATDPPQKAEIPTLNLWLPSDALPWLNKAILKYAIEWQESKPRVKGSLESQSGKLHPLKVSIRGLNTWHHQYWKPSLRFRFKKNNLRDGYRNHILVAPEDPTATRSWLSMQLAEKWGMLNNKEHFVRLFINQRYKGIYTRAWRFDESLLIHEKRLPGPFFRMETKKTKPKKGFFPTPAKIFWSPKDWEFNGIETKEGIICLQQIYKTIQMKPGLAQYKRLASLLDSEAFAKWLAIRCHAGEVHIGPSNVTLWLDTTTGKFVPILIDPAGYEWIHPFYNRERALISQVHMPLTLTWLSYPENLALYIEKLNELLKTFGAAKPVEKLIRDQWKKNRPSALADLYTSELGAMNGTKTRTFYPVTKLDQDIENLCQFVQTRTKWLTQQLENTHVFLVAQQKDQFTFFIWGYTPITIKRNDQQPFQIQGYQAKETQQFTCYPSLAKNPQPATLSWNCYSFYSCSGKATDYSFVNQITQQKLTLKSFAQDPRPQLLPQQGIHSLSLQQEVVNDLVWGPGEIKIDKNLRLPEGQALTILAGTKLLLAPKVSLTIQGPLKIQGTKQAPVSIRPQIPERPFGVIALLGKQTQGSEIHYLDCEGGSQAKRMNLKLSGMFSIRDCPEIKLEHCRFGKNYFGDDGLHIVRSKVQMKDCVFEKAFSDAVDWDKVNGEVYRCVFQSAGNDGFDLSMGEVLIVECQFLQCGDKGLSVGEGSQVNVKKCIFQDCSFGTAVKDRSRLKLEQSLFEKCRVAIAAYRKKWRWEKGGTILAQEVQIKDSKEADVQFDNLSSLSFYPPKSKPKKMLKLKNSFFIAPTIKIQKR